MTPIPAADERVQGTRPEDYFGLLQVASWHGPSHLLEGCTVSASTADPPCIAKYYSVLCDLCPQQLSPVRGGTCDNVGIVDVE